jgi:beta-galactosidase
LEDFIAHPLDTPVGILLDYSTLWALEMQPHRKDFAYLKHLFVFYRACKMLGIEPDIISPQADLNRYKVLLAPNTFLADEVLAQNLDNFAAQGGSLMLGVRSGFKDTNNVVTEEPLPGLFRELVGAKVAQWHSLPPKIAYSLQSEIPVFYPEATFWAEALKPDTGTKSLATYTAFPFENSSAITEKKHGDGKVLYCGVYPDAKQAKALMRFLLVAENIPILDIPDGLTVISRGKKLFALNLTESPIVLVRKSNPYRIPARNFKLIEG